MKKHLSTICLALSLTGWVAGYSQDGQKIIKCHTDEMTEDHFKKDPQARARFEKEQLYLQAEHEAARNNKSKTAATVYTVPVVFHVLHQGGAENISDATLISALQWANDDFAKAHADASLTAAPFSSLYINSDIKLMLAHKDPNGNCTSGIVRHIDSKTQWNQGTAQSQDSYWSYTWDPTKYLNIYIVANIIPQGTVTGGGIIVGYTYKPGTWATGNPHDAIVYRYDFLNGSQARSFTHECGHWFNLAHTWGNTNAPGVACGDDGITDTPPTKGNFTGCPSSLSGNTCPGSGGLDNVQNIMNYSDCPINFTTDQTTAMRSALSSTTSGRSSVISATNHITTDIAGTGACAPTADFISNTLTYTVCSGGSLTMKNASYNGTVASYAWAADGGANVVSPTASITVVSFPTVGTSVVTLTVTNGIGSGTISKTVTVVNGTPMVPNNYFESFEAPGLPANWQVLNPNAGSLQWEQTGLAGIDGTSSYYINGPGNPANHIDYLVMPVINPQSNANNTVFTFKYAYARYSNSNNDKFEVQASKDCGGTWATVIGLTANTMQQGSGGVTSTPYIPAANEWITYDVYAHPNWFQYTGYPSVMVRFMFQEDVGGVGFGNRFYLDDIVFSDPNGVNELTKRINFQLYPNPAKSEAQVKFTLSDAAVIKMDVTDILGKKVVPTAEFNFGPGEQTIPVNKNGALGKGMYFVNLSYNGTVMSTKLIIE